MTATRSNHDHDEKQPEQQEPITAMTICGGGRDTGGGVAITAALKTQSIN